MDSEAVVEVCRHRRVEAVSVPRGRGVPARLRGGEPSEGPGLQAMVRLSPKSRAGAGILWAGRSGPGEKKNTNYRTSRRRVGPFFGNPWVGVQGKPKGRPRQRKGSSRNWSNSSTWMRNRWINPVARLARCGYRGVKGVYKWVCKRFTWVLQGLNQALTGVPNQMS